jgi:hypothetical protein
MLRQVIKIMTDKVNTIVYVNHRTGEVTYAEANALEWVVAGDKVGKYKWMPALNEMTMLCIMSK